MMAAEHMCGTYIERITRGPRTWYHADAQKYYLVIAFGIIMM
jgi:hypothetical protein